MDIVERNKVFSTPWFDVIAKTMSGSDSREPYYSIKMPDYVSIIAVTEGQDILLVRQYRPVVESYTLEVPSGHVDPGESPADAAKRELLEETGYRAENVELLGNFLPDSGRLENEMWCYYASGVVRTTSVTEIGIEVILHDYKNIMKLVAEGKIQNALHVGAILLAKLKSDPG